MKTIKELNSSKVPVVILDQRLNKLDSKVLFPDKLATAKVTITRIGLPKTR